MALKNIAVMIALTVALGAGTSSALQAQSRPAPRPAEPLPPADPAKPIGPPQGSSTPPVPKISIPIPSSGVPKETAYPEGGLTNEDAATFIKNASHAGLMEIDLAKLAQTRATRADVKAYAKMLETEHQKANDELMVVAKSKRVTIPADPTMTEKAARARLEGMTGMAFDNAYVAAMVQDHAKAVAAFTTAATNADADVQAFADKTLPTLKHHLEQAQRLAKSEK